MAPAAQNSEYAVKAAYLFNFLSFTEWPPVAFDGPTSPLNICIVGRDPFGTVLDDTMRGETVRGRPLRIERHHPSDQLRGCHVVFIAATVHRPETVLRGVTEMPVLTIGESEAFWQAGGMLRFVVEGSHVRFDANARSAQSAGLRLSARLMQVARSTT